jgi:hypothetical protein
VFFNEIHSLLTNSNISDHLPKVVSDSVFHSSNSGFTYTCNMNKFIRYVTLYKSSKICCMAKEAKTFTTMDSHIVRPLENFSSCKLPITEDVQSMDRKEWLCFIVWNANSPSSPAICLHSSVIVFFFLVK